MKSIAAALCAIGLGTLPLTFARQEGGASTAPSSAARAPRPTAQDPSDPTQLDAELARRLQPRATPESPHVAPVAPMPALELRGLVVAEGRAGSAVIGIGEALYRVDAGSVLRTESAQGGAHVLRVVSIDAGGVAVESETNGEKLVLR